ncbi:MAG: indolepyruvate oxidoreductase subunit beta [Deltaproteobacteria bacterium]|nr:indolepyruvate oxidoreductase subunit beta [Deltaproteobacteria bacterium]
MAKLDICLAGVGGQGSLTASRILGEVAALAGLNVLVGEIHGMAQRGGIVESTVRIGDGVHGPMIRDRGADVLLGFEPVETVRALGKAGAHTLVVTNTRPIVPFTVSLQGEEYPEVVDLLDRIREVSSKLVELDASQLAQEAGSAQALNTVMLGVLAGCRDLPFDVDLLWQGIETSVPQRHLEANRKAFEGGLQHGREARARWGS